MSDCFPWFHAQYAPLLEEAWAKRIVPSGCSIDSTGNVPCAPEAMRASAERWLAANTAVLPMIGGKLDQLTYTFARYMHSEVGSGTVEERVAVGEAAVNQATRRAGIAGSWTSQLNRMLIPNGMYGAIHAPAAYCASLGKEPDCNAANRWAATSRDPSVMSVLLAHLVLSGSSGGFNKGAQTQWGPEYLKNPDGSRMGSGTTAARVASFVRYAASDKGGNYYWVGPLPGVDPWHTWLAKKGPKPTSPLGMAMIEMGIQGLPLNAAGKPVRPDWSGVAATCSRPVLSYVPRSGLTFLMLSAGLALGGVAASVVARRYARTPNER